MGKWLLFLPFSVQQFLLTQPLPDSWLAILQGEEERRRKPLHDDPCVIPHHLELGTDWKRSHSYAAALIILFISGVVLTMILW